MNWLPKESQGLIIIIKKKHLLKFIRPYFAISQYIFKNVNAMY